MRSIISQKDEFGPRISFVCQNWNCLIGEIRSAISIFSIFKPIILISHQSLSCVRSLNHVTDRKSVIPVIKRFMELNLFEPYIWYPTFRISARNQFDSQWIHKMYRSHGLMHNARHVPFTGLKSHISITGKLAIISLLTIPVRCAIFRPNE